MIQAKDLFKKIALFWTLLLKFTKKLVLALNMQ